MRQQRYCYEEVLYELFELKLKKFLGRSKRKRCPEYREWTRQQVCANVDPEHHNLDAEPHHYGPRGMGQKAPDWYMVPLCRKCHQHFHDTGTLPGDSHDQLKLHMKAWVAENFLSWLETKEG